MPSSDRAEAPGVGYLVSGQQFADIVSQEMRRPPGTSIDILPALRTGRHALGSGRYETLLYCGDLDGHPIVTFTSGDRLSGSAPSAHYLRTVLAGLIGGHGMSLSAAAGYLAGRPGIGQWSPQRIEALLHRDEHVRGR